MANPYLGEIRLFAGTFAPVGWMLCDGQQVAISDYETLFMLIGTTYGGDGQSTFALPDLRGRVPLHVGPSYAQAQSGGSETAPLTATQLPLHTHNLVGSLNAATQPAPAGLVPASSNVVSIYTAGTPAAALAPEALLNTGGSQPHSNLQPYLCLNFIIAMAGTFPSQT